ncbi:hypothetical protein ACFRAO_43770 [Streptomyces sp. NPDC056656]|uniref:hypothetical protein n=1 Tax=Streptomyces sp. NPDC056656 TaxID=3345895 RepID=UPI0036935188
MRIGVVLAGVALWRGPSLQLAAVAVVTVTVVGIWLVATGLRGAGRASDAQKYGPGLWAVVVQVLRLSEAEQAQGQRHWLLLPEDLTGERARFVIRLPLVWLGSDRERQALAHAVQSRLPGQWEAAYDQRGPVPAVTFTRKPPPEPEPELPTLVKWMPSPIPSSCHLGQTHQGPRHVDTDTETPHWGISGGTGDGKTTVLTIPIVHGRQHGALVDCVTMKAGAFAHIEGSPGTRVHKTGRQAVAALAEFYVSMKAAEALKGTPEEDAIPERIMVIDEFASFVKSAKIWWKYGLKGKGMPPFEAWFHMVLMQGRSGRHKIVVGAHTFSRDVFSDTETRDLVGTKGVVGPASTPKWAVTYGVDVPRVPYQHEVKGRGVIGVTGSQTIEEIQYAYISPYEARDYLSQCPAAPSWHGAGVLAPWITEDALREAQQELAIDAFLPGGAFMCGVQLATNKPVLLSKEMAASAAHASSATRSVPGAEATEYPGQADQSEESRLPVFSLKEACDTNILPVSYGAARQRLARARRAGIDLPDGVSVEGTVYYTAKELAQWWTLVTSIRSVRSVPTV